MTFIVHVGTHKTGTTAIQRFAAANRDRLREDGLWYPSYSDIGLFRHHTHNHLAVAISGRKDRRLSEEDADRFIDYIATHRKDGETVFLSAEPFYRLTIGFGDSKGRASSAAYWEAREKFIVRMRKFLPFDDLEILICIRKQEDFARSVFQERVKVSKYHDDFSAFLHKDRAIFDYFRQVELYAKHFPRVRVVTFEGLIANGDLHAAFFELLGADISSISKRPVANASLPIELVEFKRVLNKTPISAREAKDVGRQLVKLAQRGKLTSNGGIDWLPRDVMTAFQDSFEHDNEKLRQQYAPGLPAPLFPDRARPSRTPFEGLSAKRALEIAGQLVDW